MNRNEKLINLLHFHNSCTRNGDHLILSIKTGNAHKQIMLPQTIINTFKKCKEEGIEAQSIMMVAAKWWVLSQLQE